MDEWQKLKKEWQEFKIALCKSLKIDKFIKLISKKCDYCKEDMEGKSLPVEGNAAIETLIDNNFLYEYCKCGCHTVKQIKYCPMCGRKL